MEKQGYCKQCGHNVQLTAQGGCPHGHPPADITCSWTSGASLADRFVGRIGPTVVIAVGAVLVVVVLSVLLAVSSGARRDGGWALRLNQSGRAEGFDFTPSQVVRTSSIKDAFGHLREAGGGYQFVAVYVRAKNISGKTQRVSWDWDHQPTIEARDASESGTAGVRARARRRDDSSVAANPFARLWTEVADLFTSTASPRRTYNYEEYETYMDIAPGRSDEAWMVFRVPAREKHLRLKIGRNVWDLETP